MRAAIAAIHSILAISLLSSLPAQGQSAGRLEMRTGAAQVQSGSSPARAVTTRSLLRAGDVVSLAPAAAGRIFLTRPRAWYDLAGGSRFRVRRDTLAALSGPAPKLRPGARNSGKPRDTTEPFDMNKLTVIIRSGGIYGPHHLAPQFTGREKQVTLRWTLLPRPGQDTDAMAPRIRITRIAGRREAHRTTLPLDAQSYAVPAGILMPGRWYGWSVTAGGGEADENIGYGLIRLLTDGERAAIARAEKAAEARPKDFAAQRRLAQVYHRCGLIADAIDAYERALQIRADSRLRRTAEKLRAWKEAQEG